MSQMMLFKLMALNGLEYLKRRFIQSVQFQPENYVFLLYSCSSEKLKVSVVSDYKLLNMNVNNTEF